jgi:hypothetical protein
VEELKSSDKYKKTDVNKIEFESATLLNDDTLKFKKKSGRLNLNLNLVSGVLKSGDSTLIGLDTVKYLNHRKFSYFKTTLLISLFVGISWFLYKLSQMDIKVFSESE